jgi:hypothetical protein
MLANRSFLLAAVCALPFSIIACGGSGDDDSGDDDSNVTPTGTHYGYVVSQADVVPAAGGSPTDLGLDLGSMTSAKADGKIDNRLGSALSTLSQFFDIQGTIDTAVSHGSINLLVDVQTTDFTNNATGAGLSVKFGSNPVPAACSSATDTTCGHQLDGTASFSVAAGSPDATLSGKIVNGTFSTNPGNVSLQIALGAATMPIQLDLLHARAKATGITATGIDTMIVGGLLTLTDLQTKVGPAIHDAVASLITTDCTGTPKTPPTCGCTAGSTGLKVIGILDGDLTGTTPDCEVSLDEILGYPVISAVLMPDSCSTDTCTTPDSLSLGVKVKAVKATITP